MYSKSFKFFYLDNSEMLFNSYTKAKYQKRNLIDSYYQKIVNVSRHKVFYSKLKVPDTLDGRYDLLVLFSIIFIFSLSKSDKKGIELSQILFDKIFLDLDLSLRELGAGDAGVHIKIKNMINSYMGRQKVYCECFENYDFKKFKDHIIKNVYRNVDSYSDEPNLLVKYCIDCVYTFDKKHIEFFLLNKFNFHEVDNFFE